MLFQWHSWRSCLVSEEGKPLSKKALKKLQKEKEKAERKAATAAKLAEEKAARDAANVVCLYRSLT